MNDYSDDNRPKNGNAKKIYNKFKEMGWEICDLHYNPNNWGNSQSQGYGTWTCELFMDKEKFVGFCGVDNNEKIYIQSNRSPFTTAIVEKGKIND
jgi:hypothetical protein